MLGTKELDMTKGAQNRPFKFGSKDRREFIVQDSEVALIAINDTNGNPIFLGRAKVGVLPAQAMWQIRKITYDANTGVTRVQWPQDTSSIASSEYEFVWSAVTALTITNITNANPASITVSAAGTLQNGDLIAIQSVAGMTEVNFTGSNLYTVANLVGTTFELAGIDSSLYGVYTSGGTVEYGNVTNLTYS